MAIIEVTAKLAGMRKAQSFVVYPRDPLNPDYIKVQSDRAIGRFHKDTGDGVLNWRGSNSKYNEHLRPENGAEPYHFPDDFRLMCQEVRPNSGDKIGPGVYIA